MRPHSTVTMEASRKGFTLVELIGVLAIMSILAGVIAPNVLRTMDRAAVRAEQESLSRVGEQVALYLREYGTPPTMDAWATQVAAFSDLSPQDLATNRRGIDRIFVLDGASSPAPRAMILSSMRQGLRLPNARRLRNATRFAEVWNTPDGQIPPASTWNGWSRWEQVEGSAEYLVIERINLAPIYATEFRAFTVTLNNLDTAPVSYRIVSASGATGSTVTIPGGASVVLSNLHSRDRIDLFGPGQPGVLDYSYVLSDSGKTIDFDGTQWHPQ